MASSDRDRDNFDDPDPRFLLANERTFLAWLRTALGFIAGGVALKQFVGDDSSTQAISAIAILVVCLGLFAGIIGLVRWRVTETAIRSNRPLGGSWLVPILGVLVILMGLALILTLVLG